MYELIKKMFDDPQTDFRYFLNFCILNAEYVFNDFSSDDTGNLFYLDNYDFGDFTVVFEYMNNDYVFRKEYFKLHVHSEFVYDL